MDYQVLLYYNYTKIEEPEEFAKNHLAFCKSLDLKGRILVAEEGVLQDHLFTPPLGALTGLGSSKSGRGVSLTKLEEPQTTRPIEPRDSYASGIRIPHSSP